jgi:2-oxoglutarate ferredoxin oxidoreductase subunit beta
MAETQALTKKDFKSDQEVRWCPGCGDYAVLNVVQGVMATLGVPRHKTCFVSGIGCSSRFPYYMNTYGFHSIHGRACAVATGVKTANPDLSVWIVTGDGDGLSIGGNHTAHLIRRNLDVKVLLFNNEIYGLTKGQYSPTSPIGLKTKSTPMGSVDRPFDPISFALGCGATFVARTIDTHQKHVEQTLLAAAHHKGTSFVEIYQNCVIFNDGCFDEFAEKTVRDDKTIDLRPGQKMVFGKALDRGIKIDGWEPKVVPAAEADVWKHDTNSAGAAFVMAQLDQMPDMPRPIGIFRSVAAPIFENAVHQQIQRAFAKGRGTLEQLVYSGEMWTVG